MHHSLLKTRTGGRTCDHVISSFQLYERNTYTLVPFYGGTYWYIEEDPDMELVFAYHHRKRKSRTEGYTNLQRPNKPIILQKKPLAMCDLIV